jgi:hypothetical protein
MQEVMRGASDEEIGELYGNYMREWQHTHKHWVCFWKIAKGPLSFDAFKHVYQYNVLRNLEEQRIAYLGEQPTQNIYQLGRKHARLQQHWKKYNCGCVRVSGGFDVDQKA